jgi:signal transduction histidine kinase
MIDNKEKKLFLSISDNGDGTLLTKISADGHGIKNMKHRAERIKYSFSILKNIPTGTKIELMKMG